MTFISPPSYPTVHCVEPYMERKGSRSLRTSWQSKMLVNSFLGSNGNAISPLPPSSTSDNGGGGDAYDDVQTVATTKAQARKWILEHDTKVAVPPQFAAAAAVRRRRRRS